MSDIACVRYVMDVDKVHRECYLARQQVLVTFLFKDICCWRTTEICFLPFYCPLYLRLLFFICCLYIQTCNRPHNSGFLAFYGTRRFITAFASFSHPSLSWASPIQSTYPHPTSWRSILILYASTLLTNFIHCIFLLRFLTIYIYYPNNFNLQTTMVYT